MIEISYQEVIMSSVARFVVGAALLLTGASAAMAESDGPPEYPSAETGAAVTKAAPNAEVAASTAAPAVEQAQKPSKPPVAAKPAVAAVQTGAAAAKAAPNTAAKAAPNTAAVAAPNTNTAAVAAPNTAVAVSTAAPAAEPVQRPNPPVVADKTDRYGGNDPNSLAGTRAFWDNINPY
jgi:hypothetical protein